MLVEELSEILLADEVERGPGLGCMSPACNNRIESQVMVTTVNIKKKCNFAHKQLIGNKHLSFCHAFARMPEYNVLCQA